jgi:hypothetical protein
MEEITMYQLMRKAEKNLLCKQWDNNMTEQFNVKIDLLETRISPNSSSK